jgi:hypothetical protein
MCRLLLLPVLLPVALLSFVLVDAQTPGARRHFPDTSASIGVFADQLPGGLTPAQRRTIVDHFVGTQKLTLDESAPLRALKSGFLVLHYHLAIWQSAPAVMFIIDGRTWGNDFPEVNAHESWFWHDPAGRRVASTGDKKLLMNIGDADFARYWTASILDQVRKGDYDGVFADSASPALLQEQARSDPRLARRGARDARIPELQGRTYIDAWHTFMSALDRSLAAAGVPLIPNTGPFITTWDTTRYDLTAGVFVEGFADPRFSEADWRASTDRLLDLAAGKKIIILQNYLQSTADLARRRYYLANYLLVRGDRTYIEYFAKTPLEWYPEWTLDLGKAINTGRTAADLKSAGVYRREFERGVALVNPSNSGVTIALTTPMTRVEPAGGGVIGSGGILPGELHRSPVTRIVVPAHGAEVLLK